MDIQVIYLDIQANTCTSPPSPKVSFLIFISEKLLLNIKDVEFDFRMGSILVLFTFLGIINVQVLFTFLGIINVQFTHFLIFEFLIFCFTKLAKLAYFELKKKFIFEISIKLHSLTKYG